MSWAKQCAVTGCQNKPEPAHEFCLECELAGRVRGDAPEEPASRHSSTVVVLTVAEAIAIRDVLLSDAYIARFHDSGGGDLGRAFRVLCKQIGWIESARTDGGHRKPLPVNGWAT